MWDDNHTERPWLHVQVLDANGHLLSYRRIAPDGKVFYDNPSEQRFVDAESYIFGEMKTNITAPVVRYINDLLRDPAWYERVIDILGSEDDWYKRFIEQNKEQITDEMKALVLWGAYVAPNSKWDHKPKIANMFDLSVENDYYFKDPDRQIAVYYDIYSNIHYGYVGRAAGFSSETLIQGASLNIPALTGTDDLGDQITMQIGVELWDKYGADLTEEQLHDGIIDAMRQMEEAQLAGGDLTQIRSTK